VPGKKSIIGSPWGSSKTKAIFNNQAAKIREIGIIMSVEPDSEVVWGLQQLVHLQI
jgi:hypothetical protein